MAKDDKTPKDEAGTTDPDEAPVEPVDEAPAEPVDEAPAEPVDEAPAEPVDEAPAEPVDEAPADPKPITQSDEWYVEDDELVKDAEEAAVENSQFSQELAAEAAAATKAEAEAKAQAQATEAEDEAPAEPEPAPEPEPEIKPEIKPEPEAKPEPEIKPEKETAMENKKPVTADTPVSGKPVNDAPASGSTGGTTPPPSEPTTPALAPTPAPKSEFPWLATGLILLAAALFVWLIASNNKTDDKADKAVKVALVNNKSIGVLDAKKADKTALTALEKKVDKKADKTDLAKKADKTALAAVKRQCSSKAAAAKKEHLNDFCRVHKWDPKCRALRKKAKRSGSSRSGSGKFRSPKWGSGNKTTHTSVATTNPNLEKRVAALEKNDKRQDKVLKPLYEAQDEYGDKYNARVRAALGLAPKVQAHSK